MQEQANQILIVENSPFQARLITQHIETCTPFYTVFCSTMAEVEDYLASEDAENVFMAVLNLSLKDAPDGEAVDLVLAKGIPCIVLTATFDDEIRNRFLEKNVLDYFNKGRQEDIDNMVDMIRRIHSNHLVKVLVVEDNRTARSILKKLLHNQNFSVLEAEDGKQALEVLDEHPDILLVITDYEMPRMNGFELVSALRKQYSKDRMAVIGISAHSSGALTAKFLKNGANDFLTKPFELEEFYCRVNKNIGEIERIRAIKEAYQRDYLVSVFNRKYFVETGREVHAEALQEDRSIALAVIEADGLDAVNEHYGLDAGDTVLVRLSTVIEQRSLGYTLVARSGARYLILATDLEKGAFMGSLESIMKTLAATPVRHMNNAIEAKAGVAYSFDPGTSLDDMLMRAERALRTTRHKGERLIGA